MRAEVLISMIVATRQLYLLENPGEEIFWCCCLKRTREGIGPGTIEHLIGPQHDNHLVCANVSDVMRPSRHGFYNLGADAGGK